jgi:hypothetical protein
MTETYLVGHDAVERGGQLMQSAADRISQAVSWFGEHVSRLVEAMQDHAIAMNRLSDALARAHAEGETDHGDE